MSTYLEVTNDNGNVIIDDKYFVYSVNHGPEKLTVKDNLSIKEVEIFDGVKPHAFRYTSGYTKIWIPWDLEKELVALELPDGFTINEVKFANKDGRKWAVYTCWGSSNVTKTMLDNVNIFRFTQPIKSPKAYLEIYKENGDILFSSESRQMNVLTHILRSLYDYLQDTVYFSEKRIGLIITAMLVNSSPGDDDVGFDYYNEYDSIKYDKNKILIKKEEFLSNSEISVLSNYCTSILVVDLSNMDN